MSGFLKRCRIWGKTFAPGCRRSKPAGEGGGLCGAWKARRVSVKDGWGLTAQEAWSSLDLLQGLLALPITPPLTYSLETIKIMSLELVESVPQLHVSSLYHSPMCSNVMSHRVEQVNFTIGEVNFLAHLPYEHLAHVPNHRMTTF